MVTRCLPMQVHQGRLEDGTIVAVKEVLEADHVEMRLEMKQEIDMLASLNSPYIVRFLGADLTPGSKPLMISEFCELGDLYHAIAADAHRGTWSWYRRLV